MRTVLIVQPYLPSYRIPLFETLSRKLEGHSIRLTVAAPEPVGSQAMRQDSSTTDAIWFRQTRARTLLNRPSIRHLGSLGISSHYDACVLPLAATCPDTTVAVAKARLRLSQTRIGLWGHVANYVSPANPIDVYLERRMMRFAHRVFAYTSSGAAEAIRNGVDPALVTTLNNSIDTAPLVEAHQQVAGQNAMLIRRKLQVGSRKCFSVIGGLDETKRVHLLREVMDHLYERNSNAFFLVAGRGKLEHLMAEPVARGQALHLGYADAVMKAQMCAISEAVVNLGRIGLIAVDALSLEIPVITSSDYVFHAPEFDYLDPNRGEVFLAGRSQETIGEFLTNFTKPEQVAPKQRPPTLEYFAERFSEGIKELLGAEASSR